MPRSVEVDAYMGALEHPMAAQVERLRSAILGVDARINESIKWNAPSFYIDDHFATFNLHYPDLLNLLMNSINFRKGYLRCLNILMVLY